MCRLMGKFRDNRDNDTIRDLSDNGVEPSLYWGQMYNWEGDLKQVTKCTPNNYKELYRLEWVNLIFAQN